MLNNQMMLTLIRSFILIVSISMTTSTTLFAEEWEEVFRFGTNTRLFLFGDIHPGRMLNPTKSDLNVQSERDNAFIAKIAELAGSAANGQNRIVVLLEDTPYGEEILTDHFQTFIDKHPILKSKEIIFFGWDNKFLGDMGVYFGEQKDEKGLIDINNLRVIELTSFYRSYLLARLAEAAVIQNPKSLVIVNAGASHIQDQVAKEFLEQNKIPFVMSVSKVSATQYPFTLTMEKIRATHPGRIQEIENTFRDVDKAFFKWMRDDTIQSRPDQAIVKEFCGACECLLRKLNLLY